MAADGGTDVIDHNLAVEMGELFLHQIGDGTGVIHAGGHGDKALAVIIVASLGVVFHLLDDLLDHGLFAADLLTGDEVSLIIHVQQRADLKRRAEPAGSLGDTAAAYIEGEVGGEEPMVQMQTVCFGKVTNLLDALALITQVGQLIH